MAYSLILSEFSHGVGVESIRLVEGGKIEKDLYWLFCRNLINKFIAVRLPI